MTYAITMVTYHSDTFLNDVLNRCWALTERPEAVIIVDNASTDTTQEIIAEHQQLHPELVLLRNPHNTGFAHGQNQAIALARRKNVDAVLLLNPDVLLESTYPEVLLRWLGEHRECGSLMGKLYRMDKQDSPIKRVIDSTGFVVTRSLSVNDRGAGVEDVGQFEQLEQVFGGSGAATMYTLRALDDCAINGMIFDEGFVTYKEDVDLAWRLRWRGWQHWYHPDAIAYHYRAHRGGSIRERIQNRFHRSAHTRRLSYGNTFRIVIKNIPLGSVVMALPWMVIAQSAKFVYCLVMEPSTLGGFIDTLRALPQLIKERRIIRRNALAKKEEVRSWLTGGGAWI